MKEITQTLITPFENNADGWIMFIIMWLCVIFISGAIALGVLAAINYLFNPIKEGYGKVVAKYFNESHYSTILVYDPITKMSMPQTTYHPDAWKLTIEIEGLKADYCLSAEKYTKWDVGKSIFIKYTTGRIWKTISIKNIQL